jgi:hypothetical protein
MSHNMGCGLLSETGESSVRRSQPCVWLDTSKPRFSDGHKRQRKHTVDGLRPSRPLAAVVCAIIVSSNEPPTRWGRVTRSRRSEILQQPYVGTVRRRSKR